MRKEPCNFGLLLVYGAFLLASTRAASALPNHWLNAKLEEAIQVVRTDPPRTPERAEALDRIAWLTRGVSPYLVSDRTIADMVALLDMNDDQVRFYIAGALGNLGLRAKAAIPKLLAILPVAECVQGSLTSPATILPALEGMGVKPPPWPTYEQCKAAGK